MQKGGNTRIMEHIEIHISGGELSEAELKAYIEHGREKNSDYELLGMNILLNDEYADIEYRYSPIPNEERVCIGGMIAKFGAFNHAKQAEYLERTINSI